MSTSMPNPELPRRIRARALDEVRRDNPAPMWPIHDPDATRGECVAFVRARRAHIASECGQIQHATAHRRSHFCGDLLAPSHRAEARQDREWPCTISTAQTRRLPTPALELLRDSLFRFAYKSLTNQRAGRNE